MRRTWLASCLAVAACSGGDGGPPTDAAPPNFDRRELVRHVAADLLQPAYTRFATSAGALAASVELHCDTLEQGGDFEVTGANTRIAWATAIDDWELIEAVQVGPASADNAALRGRVYAWPLLAPCTIDQDVVRRWTTPSSYDVGAVLDNARSLAALEYLLHHVATSSSCPVTPGGWDALGASLPRARCELAAVIAADVRAHADQLATTWSPSGGDYVATLTALPERDAVNMVSDSLFYVDRMVKDMKLGESAGIVINSCGTIEEPCLREMEHRFADRGTQALRINVRALRDVFVGDFGGEHGDGGLGFDDYLIAVGAPDVAARMTANLDDAVAALDAMSDSYTTALTTDRASVVAAHAAVKRVTDDMKSQFLTVLGLDIPEDVAGDND